MNAALDAAAVPNAELPPLADLHRHLDGSLRQQTLDELAGPDAVRIEDTGVEWRVLDTDSAGSAGPASAKASSRQASSRQACSKL